jgi:hypothetical protein
LGCGSETSTCCWALCVGASSRRDSSIINSWPHLRKILTSERGNIDIRCDGEKGVLVTKIKHSFIMEDYLLVFRPILLYGPRAATKNQLEKV